MSVKKIARQTNGLPELLSGYTLVGAETPYIPADSTVREVSVTGKSGRLNRRTIPALDQHMRDSGFRPTGDVLKSPTGRYVRIYIA